MKLAILDDYQNVARDSADWSEIEKHAEITVFNEHLGDEKSVIASLQEFTVICCMRERTPFPRSVLEQLPNLKLLTTSGGKNASIDMVGAKELGIIVCGTNSPAHAASELAWGMILSLARNIHVEDRLTRNGQWQTTIGTDLKGQTIGIVGLGRHGGNVSRFAKAFGMNVIAWSQNLSEERCNELDVKRVDKETLFKQADVISLHLIPGTRNIGVVSTKEFDAMKPNAILVNTSRGSLINESAMLEALSQDKIGGLGLDVYDVEPLPKNHPLLTSEKTLLTSHIGFVTKQTYEIFYGQTVDAVKGWINEKPIKILNS